jgi:hypothetical protein
LTSYRPVSFSRRALLHEVSKAHAVIQILAKDFFCNGALDMKVLFPLSYTRLKVECCREIDKTGVQHICDSLHFNAKITMQPETRSLTSTVELTARIPGGTVPVRNYPYQQPPADRIQPFTCAGGVYLITVRAVQDSDDVVSWQLLVLPVVRSVQVRNSASNTRSRVGNSSEPGDGEAN